MGGAGIGCGGGPHPKKSGGRRGDRPSEICDGPPWTTVVKDNEDQNAHAGHEYRDPAVLAPQERHGTLTNGAHDLLHSFIAGVRRSNDGREVSRKRKPGERRNYGQIGYGVHVFVSLLQSVWSFFRAPA